jgi:hypothetical protein
MVNCIFCNPILQSAHGIYNRILRFHPIPTPLPCLRMIGKKYRLGLKSSSLPLGLSPLSVFVLETSLHPGNGDGSPYASPEERDGPADLYKLVHVHMCFRTWLLTT